MEADPTETPVGNGPQVRVRRLETLLDACSYLSSTIDMATILSRITEVAKSMLDAAEASIMLLDEKRAVLSFFIVTGEKGEILKGQEIQLGEGVAGCVAQTGKPLLVPDCASHEKFSPRFDQHTGFKTRSLLCVPLLADGRVLGVLEAVNKNQPDETFVEADLEMALKIAHIASAGIVNARLYEDLKDAQAEMVHAGKLAAIGTLASGMAHELNQPLTGILGFVQLLMKKAHEGKLVPEETEKYLGLVEKQVRRMTRIINHMRAFAHPSRAETSDVQMNQVVEDAATLVQGQLKDDHVALALELDPALPTVPGDAVRLEEVVINLLTNARDAVVARSDGTREIRVRTRTVPERQGIVLEVVDTGTGIPSEILPRIFEPFFTTRTRGKGTGLGLSLAYGIVRDHGGTIEVASQPEQGSTFSVHLPLQRDGETPQQSDASASGTR